MSQDSVITGFWKWFSGIAMALAADSENPALLKELDSRIHVLDSRLSWEIGPGTVEPMQLVISPNLDRDLKSEADKIVSHAPEIEGWEFYSARRPKLWDYQLEMQRPNLGGSVHVDTRTWMFVLLKYDDGYQELLLTGEGVDLLDEDERWQAAAITLESILGEELLLERIDHFELVKEVEPQFAQSVKPIEQLRETVLAGNGGVGRQD